MKEVNGNRLNGVRLMIVLVSVLILLPLQAAGAATLDEIVAMSDAGLPTEVIIEVIDVTGLDDTLDVDAITWLIESELNPDVLEFLLEYYYSGEDKEYFEDEENDPDEYSNRRSGEGFHGSSGYNPLRDRDDGDYYQENNNYGYHYSDNTYYPNVYVYEPPVYMMNNGPYYGAYRAPRIYNYNQSYRGNGNYAWYDGNYYAPHHYNEPYWNNYYEDHYRYDNRRGYRDGWFGGLFGDWYYDGHRHNRDLNGGIGYRSDGVRLRISF